MLRSSYTYLSAGDRKGHRRGIPIVQSEAPRDLGELLTVVDRFAAIGVDGGERFRGGNAGSHAWISIIDQGFVVHAYFTKREITFELYGPNSTRYGDPFDGSGLAGKVNVETLRGVIALLDEGRSPRDYIRANAISCAVIED